MKTVYFFLKTFGLNLKQILFSLAGVLRYLKNYYTIKQQIKIKKLDIELLKKPILTDWYSEARVTIRHYFNQDLYIARLIYNNNPKRHIDIGSRIDGFLTHVASFREIEVFDIREVKTKVKNIIFKCADLMNPKESLIEKIDSISCLHALEHFGLGRYGDPINIEGSVT